MRCSIVIALAFAAIHPVSAQAAPTPPRVINSTMTFLQGKTSVPRWAPGRLPASEVGIPTASTWVADVATSRDAYEVKIFFCDRWIPINRNDPDCGDILHIFGTFSVQVYPTPALAQSALNEAYAKQGAECRPLGGAPRLVLIAPGVTGQLWTSNPTQLRQLIRWKEHGWRYARCDLFDSSGESNVAAARDLIQALERLPPPWSTGIMFENPCVDCEPTIAEWVDGRTLVKTWGKFPDYAVALTAAMEKWRSSK